MSQTLEGSFLAAPEEDSAVLADTTATLNSTDLAPCMVGKDPLIKNLAAGDLDTPVKPATQPQTRHPCSQPQDHMKVYLRVRPLTAEEEEQGESQVSSCDIRDCGADGSPS